MAEKEEREGTSLMGVVETRGRYDQSLSQIGKQTQGGTVGISYCTWTGLRLIPMAIRLVAFIFLGFMYFAQRPFAWIPGEAFGVEFLANLANWEMFSFGTWVTAMAIYTLYLAISLVQSNIRRGLAGAEIHFARYGKIVKTLRPGQRTVVFDPRVHPYAVVSTKDMLIEMEPVEGRTTDNITLTYRGKLLIRVVDTFKLLERGGFSKFLLQLSERFESIMLDHIVTSEAKQFNRFFVEPVALPVVAGESVTTRLNKDLESSQLTVKLLTDMSHIGELDVSKFDLAESPATKRRSILPGLEQLAQSYGITVIDHVPAGNEVPDEYLKTRATPLVSSLMRLSQATDALEGVRRQEIDEEITARVADKELGVLAVDKIIKEIASITRTLKGEENLAGIVTAKVTSMDNVAKGLLVTVVAQVDSLLARIRAKAIDTAGAERYMHVLEAAYKDLKDTIAQYVPTIDQVWVSDLRDEAIMPRADVLKAMLETTGTQEALDRLKAETDTSNVEAAEADTREIEKAGETINVEEQMKKIHQRLGEISSSAGISNDKYSPESVIELVNEIARKAGISDTESAPAAAAASV